jgi:hypothetical protein
LFGHPSPLVRGFQHLQFGRLALELTRLSLAFLGLGPIFLRLL